MLDKNIVLNEIIEYYLNSKDFNGVPLYRMKNYDYDILCKLIDENIIEVLSDSEVINPHIKGMKLNIPKEKQKINIKNRENYSVLYPTKEALKNINIEYTSPYTEIMQRGENQFKIIYFDIEILERYINNPKFIVMDNGYRGNIYPKDEYYEDKIIEDEYIKDYGMAYIEGNEINRAIGVFVCDLAKLSPRKQMLWKGFELLEQDKCKINSGFVKNLLYGEWVTKVWIFHALLEEMKIINKQCEAMEIPKLFNKTFGTHYTEMPEGYRNIFLPSLKNYYDFILVLEKMLVHNISYKTFQKKTPYIISVERTDERGKDKGSLVMFDEWLNKNISTKEDMSELIIKPLKNIRKIRQKPAHELTSNKYDISLYKKQIDLMNDTYSAIRAIRLFFSNHPLTKNIEVPEYLITGEDIISY
ncbi:AAA family ATPase [Clostridium perfringens]|nr:AAA family ATPase [Clostridium perfringens]